MSTDPQPPLCLALTGGTAESRRALLHEFAGEAVGREDIAIVFSGEPDAALPASARIVVVEATTSAAAEQHLGRAADLVLRADDPRVVERLHAACADYGEWTQVGLWGGAAGAFEASLGAMLHALKVPLRGAALCSVQAATLTFAAARLQPPGRVAWVAFVAAGLKAFSPGGGRVRPMVAISVQGALFGSVVQALGWNFFSVTLGGAAIGLWAALQGVLVQYLLLGDDLVSAYDKVVRWAAERWQLQAPTLAALIAGWALLHAMLAGAAALAAWRMRAPPERLRSLLARENTPVATRAPPVSRTQHFMREFARWQFWVPLALVGAVLLATGRPWEDVAWLVARFVAAGAVFVAVLSLFQPARLAGALRQRGWWGPAVALNAALTRRGHGPQ